MNCRRRRPRRYCERLAGLRNDVLQDLTLYLGQPFFAAEIHVAKSVMIETNLVQHRRMEVAEVHAIFDCLKANVVCSSINGTALEAAACKPHRESRVVVIAAVPFF